MILNRKRRKNKEESFFLFEPLGQVTETNFVSNSAIAEARRYVSYNYIKPNSEHVFKCVYVFQTLICDIIFGNPFLLSSKPALNAEYLETACVVIWCDINKIDLT